MKIIAIADTHGNHRNLGDLPDGDVLVHAGDWTKFGAGQGDFLVWFKDQPFDHRILILGNHEYMLGSDVQRQQLESNLDQRHGIDYIGLSPVEVDGIWFGSDAGRDVDVLVTHQPPWGVLDEDGGGSKNIRDLCHAVQPNVHIFGHIHQAYGRTTRRDTTFVNCALADPDYNPVNAPAVIDL